MAEADPIAEIIMKVIVEVVEVYFQF